jgi:glyoxylase-like metal-dependent hydrolase (beta-lactamase superfamily II)
MNVQTIAVANATLTRVGYVDVAIAPEAAGLAADDFAAIDWRSPLWADGDQVRAGAAAWFADIAGTRIVFDPVQAADDVLRADRATEAAQQTAIARLFADAGFARESVDRVVMSHIEGVGMVAWRDEVGSWSPFFPNARVLVSDANLAAFVDASPQPGDELQWQAWQALRDQGRVDTYTDGESIVDGLSAEVTGGHCPGHAVLHFNDAAGTPQATMLGHLAISPLHLATGECAPLHAEPATAWSLLRAAADDGRLLIGPLWPTPGCGRWVKGAVVAGDQPS